MPVSCCSGNTKGAAWPNVSSVGYTGLSPCPFHCRDPAHSAASACGWMTRGLCQQSAVCYRDMEMQDLCQDQLFFKKLDFSMLLLGSSSSHRTVLPEKSKQGGLGEVTHGVQSCTALPMRALNGMLQQLGGKCKH